VSEKEKDKADDENSKPAADDDDEEEASEKDGEGESSGEAEADDEGAAARVAEALGVDDAEGKPAEESEEAKAEEAAAPNRAARRREEALERRRKRKGLPPKKDDDVALPKDKNKRAKELLQRRRESAAESRPAQLEAGEMVDDALSRMWAGTTKWFRKNLTAVQWVIAAGLLVVAGYVGYTYFTEKKLGAASDLLASGAMTERALILAEDKRADEEKEADPTPVFKSADERNEKALAAYREVQQKHEGSGAAILAKLGEAGVLLDKREWDASIAAYEAVQKTQLAAADVDVRGRCIEGIALAKEGKGDMDGAMAGYKQLEGVDARGYKELAQYHQARLLLAKNNDDDREKAKMLLKTAYDKLKEPSLDKKQLVYIEKSIEQALRQIDPSLAPDKDSLSGVRGGSMSQEEIQAKIRKIMEEQGKMKKDGDGDGH
jgi:hypothetical protein